MKKYDAIIIGSGLSGLSCGYYLSKQEKTVLILEKMAIVGGRTASWEEDGMQLESGLHRMLGFYEALPCLMEECKIKIEKAIIWEDELEIRLKNNISASFGLSLFNLEKTIPSALRNNELISLPEKLKLSKFFIEGFLDLKNEGIKMDKQTLEAYALKKGLPKRVIFRLLTPLTEGLFFIPPEKYSAYVFFALFAPYLTKLHKTRVGAFSGGMTEVMTGPVARRIEKMGSVVKTRNEVEKIIIEDNHVKGVIVGKSAYYTERVIIASGIKDAERLIKKSDSKNSLLKTFEKLDTMPSVNVQIELKRPALPIDRVTFSPGTIFSSYSEQSRTTFKNTNGRLSIILANSPAYVGVEPEKILRDLKRDAKNIGVDLTEDNVLKYKVITWKDDFYSYAPGNIEYIPDPETTTKGLYLAGDYTNQKYLQTMEGAVESGKIVAGILQ